MLGRLLQSAASTFAQQGGAGGPGGSRASSTAPLESVTEEAHTRDLLFPELPTRGGLGYQTASFDFLPLHSPRPATGRDATNFDDRGGLEVSYPADVRVIIAQDANSRYHQPQVLYDSKPLQSGPNRSGSFSDADGPTGPRLAQRGKSLTSPQGSAPTSPRRRRQGTNSSISSITQMLPSPLSPTVPRSPDPGSRRTAFGEGRSRTFSQLDFEPSAETAQSKIAKEAKEDMEALLGCMFGAPGFRLEPGTKLHVIPRKTPDGVAAGKSGGTGGARPTTSGGGGPQQGGGGAAGSSKTRNRTPLVRSTSAADGLNNGALDTFAERQTQPSANPKPSVMFTRLFNVVLPDSSSSVEPLDVVSSPIVENGDPSASPPPPPTKTVKQKKIPVYAVAVVLHLPPETHQRLRAAHSHHSHHNYHPSSHDHGLSSLGSSLNDPPSASTPAGSWKASDGAGLANYMERHQQQQQQKANHRHQQQSPPAGAGSHLPYPFESALNAHIPAVLAHWNVVSRALERLEVVARAKLLALLEQYAATAPVVPPPPLMLGKAPQMPLPPGAKVSPALQPTGVLPPTSPKKAGASAAAAAGGTGSAGAAGGISAPKKAAAANAALPNPKKAQKVTQQSVYVFADCLQGDKAVADAADAAAQNVIAGLRVRRAVPGQGRWGAWREEARWVGRWAGGRDQNYFFFTSLTAFLGCHTEWVEAMVRARGGGGGGKAKSEKLSVVHGGARDGVRIPQRTVIVCPDKMAARRLIFLLAAFLPSQSSAGGGGTLPSSQLPSLTQSFMSYSESPPLGPPVQLPNKETSFRSSESGKSALQKTPLRGGSGDRDKEPASTSSKHNRSVSFSLVGQDDEPTSINGSAAPGGGLVHDNPDFEEVDIRYPLQRRGSDARSSIRNVAIPGAVQHHYHHGSGSGAPGSSRKASMSTVTADDSAQAVPHFANAWSSLASGSPATPHSAERRHGSGGSLASVALTQTLKRSDSSGLSSSGGAEGRMSGRWGIMVSGLWGSRRNSSVVADGDDVLGSSLESPSRRHRESMRSPQTLERMSEEGPSIFDADRSRASASKSPISPTTTTVNKAPLNLEECLKSSRSSSGLNRVDTHSSARSIPRRRQHPNQAKPEKPPLKLSFNENEGYIDIAMRPAPAAGLLSQSLPQARDSLASSLASSYASVHMPSALQQHNHHHHHHPQQQQNQHQHRWDASMTSMSAAFYEHKMMLQQHLMQQQASGKLAHWSPYGSVHSDYSPAGSTGVGEAAASTPNGLGGNGGAGAASDAAEVAGWLKTFHPDFALQAVRPYDELARDVRAAMAAEAELIEPDDGGDAADAGWVDVCTTLLADAVRFSVERVRLQRRRRPGSPKGRSAEPVPAQQREREQPAPQLKVPTNKLRKTPTSSPSPPPASTSPYGPPPPPGSSSKATAPTASTAFPAYETRFVTDRAADADPTLADAVGRVVLAHAGAGGAGGGGGGGGSSASSRNHSRAHSRAASPGPRDSGGKNSAASTAAATPTPLTPQQPQHDKNGARRGTAGGGSRPSSIRSAREVPPSAFLSYQGGANANNGSSGLSSASGLGLGAEVPYSEECRRVVWGALEEVVRGVAEERERGREGEGGGVVVLNGGSAGGEAAPGDAKGKAKGRKGVEVESTLLKDGIRRFLEAWDG